MFHSVKKKYCYNLKSEISLEISFKTFSNMSGLNRTSLVRFKMMKLSKMTDYAVIILAEMAKQQDVLLSSSALASATELPEPTVSKILKLLGRHNIVESVRGVNGGYKLLQSPENITIATVVAAIDGPLTLTSCVDHDNECCERMRDCSMRGKWAPVNQAMQNALESISLHQMMGTK